MKRSYIICSVVITLLCMIGCNETQYIHVGPNWDSLSKLTPPKESFAVNLSTDHSTIKEGEEMRLSVLSEKSGQVWVVNVDQNDELIPILPNNQTSDNTITANAPFMIPPKGADWTIEAAEPYGKLLIACIVTTGNTDLKEALENGDISNFLGLINKAPLWGIKTLVIDVTKGKES